MSDRSILLTERILANVWRDVLQSSRDISNTDSFFDLGGDSIGSMMMIFQVKQELGVQLEPDDVFANPTLGALAAKIESLAKRQPLASSALEEIGDI